jgi:hypothetical protein
MANMSPEMVAQLRSISASKGSGASVGDSVSVIGRIEVLSKDIQTWNEEQLDEFRKILRNEFGAKGNKKIIDELEIIIEDNSKTFKEKIKDLYEKIKTGIKDIGLTQLKEFGKTIKGDYLLMKDEIKNALVNNFKEFYKGVVKNFTETIETAYDSLKEVFADLANDLKGFIKDSFVAFGDSFRKLLTLDIKGFIFGIFDYAKKALMFVLKLPFTLLKTAVSMLWSITKTVFKIGWFLVNTLYKSILWIGKTVLQISWYITKFVLKLLYNIASTIASVVWSATKFIIGLILTPIKAILGVVVLMGLAIFLLSKTVRDFIMGKISGAFSGFFSMIWEYIGKPIEKFFVDLFSGISELGKTMYRKIGDLMEDLWEGSVTYGSDKISNEQFKKISESEDFYEKYDPKDFQQIKGLKHYIEDIWNWIGGKDMMENVTKWFCGKGGNWNSPSEDSLFGKLKIALIGNASANWLSPDSWSSTSVFGKVKGLYKEIESYISGKWDQLKDWMFGPGSKNLSLLALITEQFKIHIYPIFSELIDVISVTMDVIGNILVRTGWFDEEGSEIQRKASEVGAYGRRKGREAIETQKTKDTRNILFDESKSFMQKFIEINEIHSAPAIEKKKVNDRFKVLTLMATELAAKIPPTHHYIDDDSGPTIREITGKSQKEFLDIYVPELKKQYNIQDRINPDEVNKIWDIMKTKYSGKTEKQLKEDIQTQKQQLNTNFAIGGIVRKPTNALIGEAGYPEAVIPLNNTGTKFIRETLGSMDIPNEQGVSKIDMLTNRIESLVSAVMASVNKPVVASSPAVNNSLDMKDLLAHGILGNRK